LPQPLIDTISGWSEFAGVSIGRARCAAMDGTGSSGIEPGFDQFEETALAVGCGGEGRLGDLFPRERRVFFRMVILRIAKS
jgi:hypothetical protein